MAGVGDSVVVGVRGKASGNVGEGVSCGFGIGVTVGNVVLIGAGGAAAAGVVVAVGTGVTVGLGVAMSVGELAVLGAGVSLRVSAGMGVGEGVGALVSTGAGVRVAASGSLQATSVNRTRNPEMVNRRFGRFRIGDSFAVPKILL